MAVYLDEACTRKAAEVTFPASRDWQEVQGSFSAPAGTFPLFFRLNCTGRVDWESFILTQTKRMTLSITLTYARSLWRWHCEAMIERVVYFSLLPA